MVILYLDNQLQLKDDATHIVTKFELSDTMNFSNILARSESPLNKYAVLFNIELDPKVKYYARAQALLSTGWTKHANLDVVEVRLSGLTGYKQSILPSKVSTPILKTNSTQDSHAISNFTIEALGFNRVGTAKHNKTIYFITNSEDKLLWYRISEIELNKIEVNDLLLEEDEVYKINAIFGSSSNDHSQVASMTICTGGNENLFLLSDPSVAKEQDLFVNFMRVPNLEEVEYKLYEYSDNIFTLIAEDVITGYSGYIPKEYFVKDLYVLKTKSNLDLHYKNDVVQVTI